MNTGRDASEAVAAVECWEPLEVGRGKEGMSPGT